MRVATRPGKTTVAAGVTSRSTMVAVRPTVVQAALLSPSDPADLHCTLAFLGDYDGDLETLAAALSGAAAAHAPLHGQVGGVGVFADNGKGHPQILLPSVPGLTELRLAVTEALVAAGVDYGREHGFHPHMTVGYSAEPVPPGQEPVGSPLDFTAIHVVRGGAEELTIPLSGPKPVTAAGSPSPSEDSQDGPVGAETPRIPGNRLRIASRSSPEPPIPGVSLHNQALAAARARNDDVLEPRLARILTPILLAAGRQAAQTFITRTHIVAAATTDSSDNQKTLTAANPPGWTPPAGDELLNIPALAAELHTKTDPVRQAAISSTMKATLGPHGIAYDTTNPFTAKVLAQSGSQVTAIAATTQANVMASISSAYEQGLSIPDTATLIRQGMAAATPARATLIARTELAGAVNGGSLAATQIVESALGIGFNKVWQTAPGATFPRHEDYNGLDGQTTTLDGYFDVGGYSLQFPGDPDGPAEEVCNCRCALVYEESGSGAVVGESDTDVEVLDAAELGGDQEGGGMLGPQFPVISPEGVDLGGGPLVPAADVLPDVPDVARMRIEGDSKPIYRTEHADPAYKGKAVWGDGKYFGTDFEQTAELQLNPHAEMGTPEFDKVPDPLLVDTYQLPANARILEFNADELSSFDGVSGEALKKKVLDGGYDGVHIISGDLNLGGDQIVLYRPLADIQQRREIALAKAREPRVAAEAPPAAPAIPAPVAEEKLAALIRQEADRPKAHLTANTLTTQISRTRGILRDLATKQAKGEQLTPAEVKRRLFQEKKLAELLNEKEIRSGTPQRQFAHWTDERLTKELDEIRQELLARGDYFSPTDRAVLDARLRALVKEKDYRNSHPKARVSEAQTVVVTTDVLPAAANARVASLQGAYTRMQALTSGTRLWDWGQLGTKGWGQVEQQVISAGADVAAEVEARMEAAGASAVNEKARRDATLKVLSEIRPMGKADPTVSAFGKASGSRAARQLTEMASNFYPRAWIEQGTSKTTVVFKESRRGYFRGILGTDGRKEIVLSPSRARIEGDLPGFDAAVHELGHLMERVVPSIRQLEATFYERRTADSPLEKLPWSTKTRPEFTRPDEFVEPYIGRDYQAGADARGGFARGLPEKRAVSPMTSSEVLTVGMQDLMGGGEYSLWSRDPEMRNLILGILATV